MSIEKERDALAAELAAIRAVGGEGWKDHMTTQLVGQLVRCAKEFGKTQQLRDRILGIILPAVAQHQRIVAAMAAESDQLARDLVTLLGVTAERDEARAELAAIKAQEPVLAVNVEADCVEHTHPDYGGGYFFTENAIVEMYALPPLAGQVARKQEPAIPYSAGLSAFAKDLIDGALQGDNFDGGEIQELAVKCGLLQVENRTESCGEHCACAEFGFPSECYRLVKFIPPLAGQVSVPEWVPVSERLPDDHSYVIVIHDGLSMVGWYATRDEVWRSASMVPLNPTHWMPLPAAPALLATPSMEVKP